LTVRDGGTARLVEHFCMGHEKSAQLHDIIAARCRLTPRRGRWQTRRMFDHHLAIVVIARRPSEARVWRASTWPEHVTC